MAHDLQHRALRYIEKANFTILEYNPKYVNDICKLSNFANKRFESYQDTRHVCIYTMWKWQHRELFPHT